jgi:hypothetical protein
MPKGGNGNGGNGSKPPKITDQAFSAIENSAAGTSLGFVVAGIDPSKSLWSIVSGNGDGAYFIDPDTGGAKCGSA